MDGVDRIRFASFKYDGVQNLGDEIQSIAAEQFLPRIDMKLDRDTLGGVKTIEKYLIIMNGWFAFRPQDFFPPSDSILPIFFGFHMTEHNNAVSRFLSNENVCYFKKHEPIGCRDRRTMKLLADKGVDAFYSKCLTLTFPRRSKDPIDAKVFIVDADHIPIPDFLHDGATTISQDTYTFFNDHTKTSMAKDLLFTYQNQARLVITTRLHCALPCIAMGIPVIFFGDVENTRISLVRDVNIPINRLPPKNVGRAYRVLKNNFLGKMLRNVLPKIFYADVDWNPMPEDIEQEKEEILKQINKLINMKKGAV
jgi:hypothetical protein